MPETETKVGDRGLLLLKAATTVGADQGTFDAVISTGSVDRELDVVDPGAMVKALHKWLDVGKMVPLDWNHGTAPADQIGHIDPATVKAVDNEVVGSGFIDQSTDNGEHAWRLVKSGTLGFSFFAMIPEGGAEKRKGGGWHITALDVIAVTATPTPMNADTRVVAWKSAEMLAGELQQAKDELVEARKHIQVLEQKAEEAAKGPEGGRAVDPLQEASRQAVADIRLDGVPERKSPVKKQEPRPEPPSEVELRERFRDLTLQLLRET